MKDLEPEEISKSSKANLKLRLGLAERNDEVNDAGSVAERWWACRLDVLTVVLGKSTEYFQAIKRKERK